MDNWLRERLALCLDFEIPDEMINVILSMKSSEEIDEYFQTLLNVDLPEHRVFVNDFKQRLFGKNQGPASGKVTNRKDIGKRSSPNQNSTKKPDAHEPSHKEESKKKTKYVSLYSKDGNLEDTVLLKGRHHCECQARKHQLINNCLRCGRIVCEQEGSGPCLFCGNLVCTEEEKKLIRSSTKKGENLKKSLMEQNRPKGWEEALAQRNRLLEYDRTSEKRTTVIDDEADYFQANSVWLSDAERGKLERLEKEMRDKKHSSRLTRKVTLDFAGRQVIDEPQITAEYEDKVLTEIAKYCSEGTFANVRSKNDDVSDDIHPGYDGPLPVYVPVFQSADKENRNGGDGFDGVYNRVQDKELLEIQDQRQCLSMHQPWASLLVEGIKKHEGRSWYTAHRGRLWIAATVKPVDMEEVKRMENFYRVLYNDDSIKFPSQYPSGCLLGCVSVQDCLPQEEYRKTYPDGESESPFVFICTNPQELPIRFPIKGSHKIYKVDPNIHTAAVKSLQRLAKLKSEVGD